MAILWRPLLVLFVVLAIPTVILVLVFSGGGDDDGGSADDKPAVAAAQTDPPADENPENPDADRVSAQDLGVGDCITNATSTFGDNVRTFDRVDCAKPHDGEVFTSIKLAGAAYPGLEVVSGKGQRGCRARLRRQATYKAFRDRQLGYKFVYPTRLSWAQEYRAVTCLATFKKPRTGKLEQRAPAAS